MQLQGRHVYTAVLLLFCPAFDSHRADREAGLDGTSKGHRLQPSARARIIPVQIIPDKIELSYIEFHIRVDDKHPNYLAGKPQPPMSCFYKKGLPQRRRLLTAQTVKAWLGHHLLLQTHWFILGLAFLFLDKWGLGRRQPQV